MVPTMQNLFLYIYNKSTLNKQISEKNQFLFYSFYVILYLLKTYILW